MRHACETQAPLLTSRVSFEACFSCSTNFITRFRKLLNQPIMAMADGQRYKTSQLSYINAVEHRGLKLQKKKWEEISPQRRRKRENRSPSGRLIELIHCTVLLSWKLLYMDKQFKWAWDNRIPTSKNPSYSERRCAIYSRRKSRTRLFRVFSAIVPTRFRCMDDSQGFLVAPNGRQSLATSRQKYFDHIYANASWREKRIILSTSRRHTL